MNQHEEAFVRALIAPNRRERYRQFLADPRRRSKILNRLSHMFDLDYSLARRVPSGHYDAAEVERLLRQKGAGATCHVISEGDYDGQEMPLQEAVAYAVGYDFGTILCCIPSRLAFYKGEEIGAAYILERNR